MKRPTAFLLVALTALAADPRVQVVRKKLDLIESGKAKPGSIVTFTIDELNAFARFKATEVVPEGLRQPRLELGYNTATAYALIDFLKVRHGAGIETNWLIAKLIQGEKPVKVVASLQSANGRAKVHLVRVEISGLAVSGSTLDVLIHTFFTPLYPDAKIDEWFDLAKGIDRIDTTPTAGRAYIKR